MEDTRTNFGSVEHEASFFYPRAKQVKEEHFTRSGDIPVVKWSPVDQVTYHGPGQQIALSCYSFKAQ